MTGDAMARPLIEEFGRGHVRRVLAGDLQQRGRSRTTVKEPFHAHLHPRGLGVDRLVGDGFHGIGRCGRIEKTDGTGDAGRRHVVLDDDDRRLDPAPGVIGRLARGGNIPLGYYKDPEKTAACSSSRRHSATRCPATSPGSRTATVTLLGRGQLRQHRRGEGLPRGGGGRAEVAPRRLRRPGDRCAGRAVRPAGRRRGRATRGVDADARRARRSRPSGDRRLQGAAHSLTWCRQIPRHATGKADYPGSPAPAAVAAGCAPPV